MFGDIHFDILWEANLRLGLNGLPGHNGISTPSITQPKKKTPFELVYGYPIPHLAAYEMITT